jgi:PAS domain S-box-containing protein
MEFENLKNTDHRQMLNSYKRAIDVNIITSIADCKGTIIYVNEKFCEISKYQKNELIGQNHRIINSNYHSKAFFEDLWKTIKAGQTWQGEIKNKAKDGSYYWVDTVILPIETDNEIQYLSLRTLISSE